MSLLQDQLALSKSQFDALMHEFRTGVQMGAVQSEINQRKYAQENQRDHKSVEGLGRKVGSIDLNAWTKFAADGQRWQDPDFLPWFLKTHESARVNCGGTKSQFGYQSASAPDSKRKFTKKYK